MADADSTSSLPDVVLVRIMQKMPARCRFRDCSLVCKAWAAAAVAASDSITLYTSRDLTLARLGSWLQAVDHSSQLTQLDIGINGRVRSYAGNPMPLPAAVLSKLQSLSAKDMWLDWHTQPPNSSSTGNSSSGSTVDTSDDLAAVHATLQLVSSGRTSQAGAAALLLADLHMCQQRQPVLPQLRHMELHDRSFFSIMSLQRLQGPTGLTSLQLQGSPDGSAFVSHRYDHSTVCSALDALLQSNPGLQQLTLTGGAGDYDDPLVFSKLSWLTNLQRLQLDAGFLGHGAAEAAAGLPVSPTALELSCYAELDVQTHVTVHRPPGEQICALTNLLSLELHGVIVHPDILTTWPQLQHLKLQCCHLLPGAIVFDADGYIDDYVSYGTPSLLAAVAQLTKLRHLKLANTKLDVGISAQHFAALTASSHLTHLAVFAYDNRAPSCALPRGAVGHMFLAPRKLLQLRVLQLGPSLLICLPGTAKADKKNTLGADTELWHMDGGYLAQIVTCCPGLRQLNLLCAVRSGADFTPLLSLRSQLESLLIGGVARDDAAAGIVAQLTALTKLEWQFSAQLTQDGLLLLHEGLKGLRKLYIVSCGGLPSINWPRDLAAMFAEPFPR